jgi:hypothetical protein
MLDTIINAFTTGNVKEIQEKLIHSSAWSQHLVKHYGQEKLISIVLSWLKLAGRSKVVTSQVISSGETQVIHLQLQPLGTKRTIDYIFWLETNGKIIKAISSIVDTQKLASVSKLDKTDMLLTLPEPDPFVLCDYDQQDHLQGELAVPSNMTMMTEPLADVVDKWWSIWSEKQLANISEVYAEELVAQYAGKTMFKKQESLFNYVLTLQAKLTRKFAQIENIIAEGNNVAIKWSLDGDEGESRIRVPFISMLTIQDGTIVTEYTLSDNLAHGKRYCASKVFED